MRAIGPDERLEIVASQQHGVLDRTGLSVEQTASAAWTVAHRAASASAGTRAGDGSGDGDGDGDGDVAVGGARAIALAIAVGRGARWPIAPWRVPGFGWVADRLYLLIARYRYRLPGETPWCTAHSGECAPAAD